MQDKVIVPELRIKKKCLKVFSRMAIIATSSKRYPGTIELSELNKTILVDRRGSSEASQANLRKPRTGLPTVSSMKNLRKCMDVFQMSLVKSKSTNPLTQKVGYMRAAFLTFTIPDGHTMLDSKQGYELLLHDMIDFLKYHFGVDRYIWRFERQERGQAHWHLCVGKYCELYAVKTYWLRLLAINGLTREYYEKYDYDPSSAVVIEGIQTDNELGFYFQKYFNKKTQSDKPTAGRWWGADLCTKRTPLPLLPITERFTSLIDLLDRAGSIDKVEVEIELPYRGDESVPESLRKIETVKPCTIIRPRKLPVTWLLCPEQRAVYDQYITFNRAGDWKSARELKLIVIGYAEEVKRWIRDHYQMADDMAALARFKKIERVYEKRFTNRQRRLRILSAQRAEAEEMRSRVSLYT